MKIEKFMKIPFNTSYTIDNGLGCDPQICKSRKMSHLGKTPICMSTKINGFTIWS